MFLVSKEIRSCCKLRPRGWLTAQSNSPSVPQKLELYFLEGGSYQYQALGFRTGTSYIVLVTGTLFVVPVHVVLGIVIDPILIKILGLNIETVARLIRYPRPNARLFFVRHAVNRISNVSPLHVEGETRYRT